MNTNMTGALMEACTSSADLPLNSFDPLMDTRMSPAFTPESAAFPPSVTAVTIILRVPPPRSKKSRLGISPESYTTNRPAAPVCFCRVSHSSSSGSCGGPAAFSSPRPQYEPSPAAAAAVGRRGCSIGTLSVRDCGGPSRRGSSTSGPPEDCSNNECVCASSGWNGAAGPPGLTLGEITIEEWPAPAECGKETGVDGPEVPET
mmetsp:Transcript_55496/g.159561  ORF Transcript_55496/g.159561 Transcript_55496/m.159561 type:complete len:203 (+) Transcript_55496:685-1293(+)